jgi:glycosyltransferase involved in cell wall biosynthesis
VSDRTGLDGRPTIVRAVIRAAFVFQNPRRELLEDVRAGREPDTALVGVNHLAAFGVDARVQDPLLGRQDYSGAVGRLAWSAREVPLPWAIREADVVFTPLANLFPLVARLRPSLPVVVVNYGLNVIYDRSSRARRRLLAASLRSARAVVCLGESQRLGMIARAGLEPASVHTLLLGADVGWFAPQEVRVTEPYVLTVGKDLARDLDTFAAAVRDLDVRVEIVAHPRNLAGVALPQNARVHNFIPATELRDLYAGAACVVVPQQPDEYPYGSDGGGLTALCEAMAMGKPIVATERTVLRDYLDADELVPPRDPAALRSAIEGVLADPRVAAERGARSRRRAEERHSTQHFAERLAPILHAAAAGNLDAR